MSIDNLGQENKDAVPVTEQSIGARWAELAKDENVVWDEHGPIARIVTPT